MLSQALSSTFAIPSIAAGSDCATSFHRPVRFLLKADCAVRSFTERVVLSADFGTYVPGLFTLTCKGY